jgi:adenine phosphoribosyltransferase
MTTQDTYLATVGSQTLELPIADLSEDLSIALLISVDHGVAFSRRCGIDLAALLADRAIDVVASVATMGIPLAIETTRALGLDDYVILHKTKKIHLADGYFEPVTSITTDGEQRLILDRARAHRLEGKRVAVVDDVISTGGSISAALRLVRQVGAEVVALGCMVSEGSGWRDVLGSDADLVCTLGSIPIFHREPGGALREDWG